jgi:AhpD family alkylhydroperoxidase
MTSLKPKSRKEKSMESQIQLNEERAQLVGKLKDQVPDFMAAEFGLIGAAYKDGALSGKIKRLMSMAIALGAGCTNCILAQTDNALKAGATKEEILEAIQVVISMRGTTGVAESVRVIKFLDELGRL